MCFNKLNSYKKCNVLICKIMLMNLILVAEINSTTYWRYPFNSICNPKQLVEYVVMDIEPIMDKDRKTFPGQGAISMRHTLADVWLVRASELGITENTIHTRTHLGHILKPGDSALGYNIEDSNINDEHYEKLDRNDVPDVILVKKYYDKSARRKQRIWKLKHLAEDDTAFNPDSKYVFIFSYLWSFYKSDNDFNNNKIIILIMTMMIIFIIKLIIVLILTLIIILVIMEFVF